VLTSLHFKANKRWRALSCILAYRPGILINALNAAASSFFLSTWRKSLNLDLSRQAYYWFLASLSFCLWYNLIFLNISLLEGFCLFKNDLTMRVRYGLGMSALALAICRRAMGKCIVPAENNLTGHHLLFLSKYRFAALMRCNPERHLIFPRFNAGASRAYVTWRSCSIVGALDDRRIGSSWLRTTAFTTFSSCNCRHLLRSKIRSRRWTFCLEISLRLPNTKGWSKSNVFKGTLTIPW
jgi:hypothetical protein